MASAQQVRANQTNAQRSTGPKDTSRTRFNGESHGPTSGQTVIPGENPDEYAAFSAAFIAELDPQSESERFLAERLVAAAWRLRRFTRMETAFFNNRIEAFLEDHPGSDPDLALANLFADPAEAQRMRLFLRYQTAVQREFDTVRKQYESARRDSQRHALERAAIAEPQDAAQAFPTTSTRAMADGQTSGTAAIHNAVGFASYIAAGELAATPELHLNRTEGVERQLLRDLKTYCVASADVLL
jgi:hypothetical protein